MTISSVPWITPHINFKSPLYYHSFLAYYIRSNSCQRLCYKEQWDYFTCNNSHAIYLVYKTSPISSKNCDRTLFRVIMYMCIFFRLFNIIHLIATWSYQNCCLLHTSVSIESKKYLWNLKVWYINKKRGFLLAATVHHSYRVNFL